MSFASRYLRWLLLPPAFVGIPLSVLFISQVLDLNPSSWLKLVGLGAISGLAVVYMILRIYPYAARLETTSGKDADVSVQMSECLRVTATAAIQSWLLGSVAFALLGMLLLVNTRFGFVLFLVAGLIAAAPSIIWSYAAGKELLHNELRERARFHYVGRELTLRAKITIVFIGLFILTTAAVVILVSAKVSTTLEKAAIQAESEQFSLAYEKAAALPTIDAAALDVIRLAVAPEHALFVIRDADHIVSSLPDRKSALLPEDIREIVLLRAGDSSSYISPNVAKFRPLADGSIFVARIPFDQYQGIPGQIAFHTFLVSLVTTVIFIAATIFLTRDITGPLNELRQIAARMADGDFSTQARIFSDDEVGALAASFEDTRMNLRSLISRMGDRGNAITDGVRIIGSGTDTLVTGAKEQTQLTKSSTASLTNVRGGAQAVLGAAEKVTEAGADSASRATELLASSEAVARSMEYLFQSVDKSSASVAEMNASANSTSGRTEVLSNIGDEVLSFVTQMDATIEELRRTAQSTAEISRQVREDASAGSDAVGETVTGIEAAQETTVLTAEVMNDLQKSIGQISQILAVIEEITNKTNLLSLNAAIIAAQAGEQGAGFTVVADEIRELAERTRGSTKEIAGIVKAIQRGSHEVVSSMHEVVARVKENVELAQRAAISLSKIQNSAGQSYDMANRISAALDEQGQASRHLHDVTSRMAEHITEITRATREQASATQMLAEETERVRDIAEQVRNSTDEQSISARGINLAMESLASDVKSIKKMLEGQLTETERIANASTMMLEIAQANDSIAQEFTRALGDLLQTGKGFEEEVRKFKTS